jgi:hypothetical protein
VAEEIQNIEEVGRFAGSPILRAIGWSCGSPPDRVFTLALTC